jgi:hypothetical protein
VYQVGHRKLKVKGGHRWVYSPRIVITTNKPPDAIYNKEDEEIQQLLRRITMVVNENDPVEMWALENSH